VTFVERGNKLRKLGLITAIAGLVLAFASSGAEAGKTQIDLSFQLHSLSDGTHKVEYTVVKKGGGAMDLAVHHECTSDGETTADRMNRIYWSGRGGERSGNWIVGVNEGDSCTAVVIDVAQPVSGDTAASSAGYAAVSSPVSYVVR